MVLYVLCGIIGSTVSSFGGIVGDVVFYSYGFIVGCVCCLREIGRGIICFVRNSSFGFIWLGFMAYKS